jgi:hypothetical protein
MTVTDTMTSKMYNLGKALDVLSKTEPVSSVRFQAGEDLAQVKLASGWNAGLKERPGTDLLGDGAQVMVNGTPYLMSKDAALDLTSSVGLTRDYVCKTPGPMIESHVNYWLANSGKDYRLLTKDDAALAVTKSASIEPFSNVEILLKVEDAVRTKHGEGTEILVDYKLHHDLRRTAVRVVIPGHQEVIESYRHSASNPDTWSTGIQIVNSLTGAKPLSIQGYLFAWWCTNGAISTHAESAKYNRRTQGQEALDVQDWVYGSAKNVLDDLDHELDAIRELTTVSIEGEVAATMADIFSSYSVPVAQREQILLALAEDEDQTMYGLMQAITQAANGMDVQDEARERLMLIGGDLTRAATGRCQSCHRLPVV